MTNELTPACYRDVVERATTGRCVTRWLVVGVLLSACAGGGTATTDGRDAAQTSAPDAGTSDTIAATDGGGMCNAVVNTAPLTVLTSVASAAPTPTGGVPTPGRYHLTAWNLYTGPGGASGRGSVDLQETLELTVAAGNVVTIQLVQNDGPVTAEVHQTIQIVATGPACQSSNSCPFTGKGAVGLTATASAFHLLSFPPDGPEEYVFTKQ
jgi:hypothetical protein